MNLFSGDSHIRAFISRILIRIIPQCFKIFLSKKLVIKCSFFELESVSFVTPNMNIIRYDLWNGMEIFLTGRMARRIQIMENLFRSDSVWAERNMESRDICDTIIYGNLYITSLNKEIIL